MYRHLSLCGVLIAFLCTPCLAQSPADGERNRRLEEMEKKLRDLLKEIEAFRVQWSAAPAKQPEPAPPGGMPAGWLKGLRWRSIGPANMGGRIVDLAVCESDPSTF